MDPSRFAAFLVVDSLLVMTLGADWAYAIAANVRGRKVAPAVAGLAGGHLLHATLVVVGVGALLAQSQSVMELLTYLGAAYLLWLGTRVARDPAPLAADGTDPITALSGVATSALNPMCPLLFFALLPQFVGPYRSMAGDGTTRRPRHRPCGRLRSRLPRRRARGPAPVAVATASCAHRQSRVGHCHDHGRRRVVIERAAA